MDIKRVDDKHINIHKKQEAKLHKKDNHIASNKARTTYEKTTTNEKAISNAKALAKGVAIDSGRKMLSHIEGGEEIEESIYLGNVAMEPLKKAASKRKQLKKNQLSNANKRIKKVEKGKKLARRKTLKLSKRVMKQVAKKTVKTTTKDIGKSVVKETTKTAVEVGATVAGAVAGTAITGPYGPLIGVAAGELAGFQMDVKEVRAARRMRMLKYFQDKLSGESTSKDSLGKLIKDVVIPEIMLPIKYISKYAIVALLMMVVLISVVVIPVVAVVEVLYSSPFAIFLPPLEPGDTAATALIQYTSDFNREVITLSTEHEGYDTGRIVYVDYEGTSSAPSNYYDILCIYMVKYGFENTATIMDDSSKEDLKAVFDDMCTYTTSKSTEIIDEVSQTVLNVNISLKYYRDMQTEYGFSDEQIEVLEQMVLPEGRAQFGYVGNAGGGAGRTNARSTLSADEITAILNQITDEKARIICSFALSKVGYPYSQEYRDSGNYYDCSSLAYYSWQSAGTDISLDGAYSAAAEANWCDDNEKVVSEAELIPGDLVFYSYSNNGRYKNISHVGIYMGNGQMVEAVDDATGVVICDYHNENMIMIGRPTKES